MCVYSMLLGGGSVCILWECVQSVFLLCLFVCLCSVFFCRVYVCLMYCSIFFLRLFFCFLLYFFLLCLLLACLCVWVVFFCFLQFSLPITKYFVCFAYNWMFLLALSHLFASTKVLFFALFCEWFMFAFVALWMVSFSMTLCGHAAAFTACGFSFCCVCVGVVYSFSLI